ncbi:Single-stranded-DNA-specific exonuclease RecJ [Candidatus Trichorickettsia mobilis]|uniref:Single-stranded-DNA-specific exonuclease RecJ n=1 Tax=Candidatus Trichorickettsia mobilis TaxID=1346319 RepID=A0ABZ0URK5_9RICK|nr:single-stranded-DNA-specific exonuclease RecJ [Candidatus Trichorickettsia mobilis]WPY00146.1 Single-stranded-DNA-specific exonuclease RecJ [Candidatus Trichorickettsia mobilis]
MRKSVNGKIWQQNPLNENYIRDLSNQLVISDLLAKLLSFRTSSLTEASEFLSPKIKNLLPDPLHLLDMDKAVARTVTAIKNKQKICIFADYDVDGATSSALLKLFFQDIGVAVDIYVPDRILEGYGPNMTAMQRIRDVGTELVITVDCGTVAFEAVEHANNIGLEVIVIDHHLSVEGIPNAIAVVNPNRIDEISEYKYLAAVGVSFLFIVALRTKLINDGYFKGQLPPNLMQYLDLVALGTVCDVMPIIALNRAFVAQGLKIMLQRQNIGLKTLCDNTNIAEKLNCYHLGFVIGPRINAGGRVGKASLGANLLSTNIISEAIKFSQELEVYNSERKTIELLILEEAIAKAEAQSSENILFIVGEGWHIGVIGIIASRLKDKFNKPTAVIALNNGIGKASCRSIKNIDFGSKIINAKHQGLIVNGGGHAMAGGFTVVQEQLTALQQYFNQSCSLDEMSVDEQCMVYYDAELTSKSLTPTFMEEINRLEPFGNGNPEPIFKFSNLFVLKANIVGTNHISCLLAPNKDSYNNKSISAIAFNAIDSAIADILLNAKPYTLSVIGTLKLNSWQQMTKIQLQIKDIIIE